MKCSVYLKVCKLLILYIKYLSEINGFSWKIILRFLFNCKYVQTTIQKKQLVMHVLHRKQFKK